MNKQERANLIKQASIKLFIQFGYDKTSMIDIAKHVGISKGAIYLEFESKQALLNTIIYEQMLDYRARWLGLIENDPDAGTMTSLYKTMLLALDENEFLFNILSNPTHMLGSKYAQSDNFLMERLNSTTKQDFIKNMQSVNCITNDLSPAMIAEIMNIMTLGLLNADKIQSKFAFKQKVEAISIMLDKALTPKSDINKPAGMQIIRAAFKETI